MASFIDRINPRNWFVKNEQVTKPEIENIKRVVSPARSSEPTDNGGKTNVIDAINGLTEFVKPEFQYEVIPFIRKLALVNPDLGQAAHNLVMLGNTGHIIEFDKSVSAENATKMREELEEAAQAWVEGTAGIHGMVNKFFRQAILGGAISFESVPNNTLNGLRKVIFVNPETIRFKYNKSELKYEAYQKQSNSQITDGLKKLNSFTYRYYGLESDTELPVGTPMFLTALTAIADQKKMLENIRFVLNQMGLLGFLQMLVDKPQQKESDEQYKKRLDSFLDECKINISKSMKEGILVGYDGDHQFEFHTATKNVSGVKELFEQNELQVGSGLKQDMSMLGRGYSTSEGQITVVFQKMIAEIGNIQMTVKEALEFIYSFHLRLKGYQFKRIKVKFNPSTIMDELKMQQAQEIKIRNNNQLYGDGIISQEQYAHNLGYEKPDKKKPRIDPNAVGAGTTPAAKAKKKQAREKKKDGSDRNVREKNRPVQRSRK
jgi:hypothetical protein